MTAHLPKLRALALTGAVVALSACNATNPLGNMDWDFRGGAGALDTSEAARLATERRPTPDNRGVISYPGYQVAVARRGDTVGSVAARVGLPPDELARYNAMMPSDLLRDGEVLALPRRIDDGGRVLGLPGSTTVAAGTTPPAASAAPAPVDVSAIATTALDRVGTPTPPATTTPATPKEPVRHQVRRGETAITIARAYNVPLRALGEWNGLGPDLAIREGQYLIIPVASEQQPPRPSTPPPPGAGSPTPVPPSASQPLPREQPRPATEPPREVPASPDLGSQRSAASAAQMVMPVSGPVIRPYAKGRNEGIDISAAAGTPVRAADAGTVAAITQDTSQTPIIVIRHENNLLTVYAGVDNISVKRGDRVTRGQTIAQIRAANPSFLHFEVRRGVDSTDPMPFLQ
ncbi:MAG: peptidoglycan DD-metalloendopeptidase family protein [Cypionkella sp.]|nr:peptidoglycan DD-metalloendopeptidase family protein [Cypionkella sp.]